VIVLGLNLLGVEKQSVFKEVDVGSLDNTGVSRVSVSTTDFSLYAREVIFG
jgi:hypothetical protein